MAVKSSPIFDNDQLKLDILNIDFESGKYLFVYPLVNAIKFADKCVRSGEIELPGFVHKNCWNHFSLLRGVFQ